MNDLIGTWIAAFLTLCILSFLYKDNPFFRFAESLFAGVSLGYYIGLTMGNTMVPNLIDPLKQSFSEHWQLLFPMAIGLLLYARYIKKVSWLSKYALAAYIGYGSGYQLLMKLHGEALPQLKSSIVSLNHFDLALANDLVMLIGVLSVLVYFFFSKRDEAATLSTKVFNRVSLLGTWFLMVSFGAAFGYTVMGRISLLMGRLNFLINDWILKSFA